MDTFTFLVCAYVGGRLGLKLRLPAGALLGSMFFIGFLQITNLLEFTTISQLLRVGSKIALGIMIGLMFSRKIFMLSYKKLLGFMFVGISSVISAVLLGFIFHKLGYFPTVTGIVASSPGGIAEMLTLADEINADTQDVAMMHIIRFVLFMLLMRWLFVARQKRYERAQSSK